MHGEDELERFNKIDKAIESAKRLHIIYTYEKKAYLTDAFRYTLRIIDEDDLYWNQYLRFLYKGLANEYSTAMSMAMTLITFHMKRLGMCADEEKVWESSLLINDYLFRRAQSANITKEERSKGTKLPRARLNSQEEEWLEKQARTRHEWFKMFDVLVVGYPHERTRKTRR